MRKAIVTRSNRSILIVKYKSPNKKIKSELENIHVILSIISMQMLCNKMKWKNQKLYQFTYLLLQKFYTC